MREIRPSGSEGGVALITPSLPLSGAKAGLAAGEEQACQAGDTWEEVRHCTVGLP